MTVEILPQELTADQLADLASQPTTAKKKRGRPKIGIGSSDGESGSADPPKAKGLIERQVQEINIGLTGLLGGIAKLTGNFNQFDGAVIQMNAPGLVDACCRAARTDSRFRGWLLSIVHVSAYSDIALYASMMIVPILINHGLFPVSLFGAGVPDDETVYSNGHSQN